MVVMLLLLTSYCDPFFSPLQNDRVNPVILVVLVVVVSSASPVVVLCSFVVSRRSALSNLSPVL